MPAPARAKQNHKRGQAFWWMAFAFAVNMLGTTLPTPLYPIYQHQLGFSELLVTIIYAVYAAGVIAALIVAGRWSDQIGRRRMLFAGLAFSAASAVAFLLEGGLPALFVGRVLSGLSAGIFTGTATVAVVELAPAAQRGRATLVATAANMGGLGCGPLVAGLLSEYLPLALHLAFLVDLALIALGVLGVWLAPETVRIARRPRLAVQKLSLPPEVRGVFVPAAIAGFAGFAVLGFFTAVAPAVLGRLLRLPNHALVGAVVFLIFIASTAGQAALQWVAKRNALILGCLTQIAGVACVAAAIAFASLLLLSLGAAIAGFGQGLAFRAGMADVAGASPGRRRGEIVSTFFVVLYVAISLPVIGVGIAVKEAGLQPAGIGFAAAVALLSLIAFLMLLYRRARNA